MFFYVHTYTHTHTLAPCRFPSLLGLHVTLWDLVPAGISAHQPFCLMSLEITSRVRGVGEAPTWSCLHPTRGVCTLLLPPQVWSERCPGLFLSQQHVLPGHGREQGHPRSPCAPGSLLKQHRRCSGGCATTVQTWVQLPPDQHSWGKILSALSLVANLGSSPEGLVHLQGSACVLYIFIFMQHLVPL